MRLRSRILFRGCRDESALVHSRDAQDNMLNWERTHPCVPECYGDNTQYCSLHAGFSVIDEQSMCHNPALSGTQGCVRSQLGKLMAHGS